MSTQGTFIGSRGGGRCTLTKEKFDVYPPPPTCIMLLSLFMWLVLLFRDLSCPVQDSELVIPKGLQPDTMATIEHFFNWKSGFKPLLADCTGTSENTPKPLVIHGLPRS